MLPNEALDLVNQLLEPKPLSYLEQVVFLQSWSGKRYREIALESGYDLSYIKDVGAQLWNCLSEALGAKVTKKNVRLILENASSLESRKSRIHLPISAETELHAFPGGIVSLASSLYVDRPPIEQLAYAEISKLGSLTNIKAPWQMGKTSLALRILEHARTLGYGAVIVDLRQADRTIFSDLGGFLRWFCLYVSRRLQVEPKLADYWDEAIGTKVSCTTYFQDYLLAQLDRPIVLVLDETNRLFDYPELAQEFLPLLRSWYEEALQQAVWQKLRLVIVSCSEMPIPLSLSQSPFHVGLPLSLPEFTWEQLQDLAQRYQLAEVGIDPAALELLMALVGGHPYLIRLAFYWVRQSRRPLAQLLEEAATQAGIYSSYFQRYWLLLQQKPELLNTFRTVVMASNGVQLEAITATRLKGMGLIRLQGNSATPRCELYRQYFRSHLQNIENAV